MAYVFSGGQFLAIEAVPGPAIDYAVMISKIPARPLFAGLIETIPLAMT
jgi:hypothetical protein